MSDNRTVERNEEALRFCVCLGRVCSHLDVAGAVGFLWSDTVVSPVGPVCRERSVRSRHFWPTAGGRPHLLTAGGGSRVSYSSLSSC